MTSPIRSHDDQHTITITVRDLTDFWVCAPMLLGLSLPCSIVTVKAKELSPAASSKRRLRPARKDRCWGVVQIPLTPLSTWSSRDTGSETSSGRYCDQMRARNDAPESPRSLLPCRRYSVSAIMSPLSYTKGETCCRCCANMAHQVRKV